MNKKIILSLGASALIVSSLLAFSPGSCKQQKDGSSCQKHKMMKHHKQDRGHGIVKMFMQLDLSDEQKKEIRTIVKTSMDEMPKPSAAFSDTSFNKEEFIKISNERRAKKVEQRANLIEKVYSVLNPAQKKDLKTMLEMKELMKKNSKMRKQCD